MTKLTFIPIFIFSFVIFFSCENKEVNHADGPNFSVIHEDINDYFEEVELDGNTYYLLERDRNNPHEGFGFMALKANHIRANQDSIKAYLKTLIQIQNQILANQTKSDLSDVITQSEEIFQAMLQQSK